MCVWLHFAAKNGPRLTGMIHFSSSMDQNETQRMHYDIVVIYSKTCVKRQLKNRQNKDKVLQNAPLGGRGAFCNTFDLH